MRYLLAFAMTLFAGFAWAFILPPGTSFPPSKPGGGGQLAAPAIISAPVVTGAVTIGSLLTSTTGSWTGSPSFSYQWMRNGIPISGATSSTYTANTVDFGNTLSTTVTATNAGGSSTWLSNWDGPIIGAGAKPAIPLNYFLNSLGVQIHIGQGGAESGYEAVLVYTGIRNVRDGAAASDLSALSTLCANLPSVKIDAGEVPPLSDAFAALPVLYQAGCLGSVEGPNEPNNEPKTYPINSNNHAPSGGGASWLGIAAFQADLYQYVHSNFPGVPVYAVSEDGGQLDNTGMQFLTMPLGQGACTPGPGYLGRFTCIPDGTQFADYANPHNYVGWPSHAAIIANQAFDSEWPTCAEPSGDGVDGMCSEYGVTWGFGFPGYNDTLLRTIPRVTSETGWPAETPPTGGEVTQDQQGKLYINVFLDAMLEGWTKTFLYEAFDNDGGQADFGIFINSTTPKLSATYIHNMTTFLADTSTTTPGSYAYSIASEPVTVHDQLFQCSSGKFWIAVWDEQTVASGLTDSVTVTLPAAGTVLEYDPTVSTSPVATFTNVTSVNLTLSDHAVFLAVQ